MGIRTEFTWETVKHGLAWLLMLVLLSFLTACGEDAFVCSEDDGCGSTITGSGTTVLKFGSWNGGASQNGSFVDGAIYAATTTVASLASEDLMVSLVNEDNSVYSPSTTIPITFDATCSDSSITSDSFSGSDATVTVTYTAGTCTGTTDTITATVTIGTTDKTATIDISIP